MAKRANGISEFVVDGTTMKWVYGGTIAPTMYDCASNPDYADMSEFSKSVYWNGAKQKIADAGALPSGSSVEEKATAQRDMAAQLTAGVYTGERSSMLSEALQRMFPKKSAAEIAAELRDCTKEERKSLERDPVVVKMLQTIAVERAQKSGISAATVLERFK